MLLSLGDNLQNYLLQNCFLVRSAETFFSFPKSKLNLHSYRNSKVSKLMYVCGLFIETTDFELLLFSLEAGLCLYGSDITDKITPVEAGLTWLVAKRRREMQDFPGAEKILKQIKEGTDVKRIGDEIFVENTYCSNNLLH